MGKTLGLIAQASQNEIKAGTGGHLGDQNGAELNAVCFFSYPWGYLFRAKDPVVREKIADFMEKAVGNGYIGYDMNNTQRETLFNNLQEIDFKIEELNEKSACDCSSLVYCAVYSAIGVSFEPTQGETGMLYSPVVRMYNDYLMTACSGSFDKFTASDIDLTSREELVRGDIILKTLEQDDNNHIAVWI